MVKWWNNNVKTQSLACQRASLEKEDHGKVKLPYAERAWIILREDLDWRSFIAWAVRILDFPKFIEKSMFQLETISRCDNGQARNNHSPWSCACWMCQIITTPEHNSHTSSKHPGPKLTSYVHKVCESAVRFIHWRGAGLGLKAQLCRMASNDVVWNWLWTCRMAT